MKLLQKMASFFNRKESSHKRRGHKTRGQSLVEFAIAFPVIILLFSGVIEYGFILNYYLSLLDATRESARFYSNFDPFNDDGTDNIDFYSGAAAMVRASLDPHVVNPSYVGRRIVLDPATDDIIITVYGATGGSVISYPETGPFHMYNNHEPIFSNEDIENRLVSGSPNAGIILVEVHYSYDQVLKLPWLAPFVSDPLILRTYSMMPLSAAEPED